MAETTKTILMQIGDFLGRKFKEITQYVDEKVASAAAYFKYDTKTGSATIGENSLSTRNNEVSVGSENDKVTRFIANVTAGIKDTDAVNVAQMKQAIADLVNGAPETLDTLKEVADALTDNSDVVATLRELINEKYEKLEGEIAIAQDAGQRFTRVSVNDLAENIGTYEQFVTAFNNQVGKGSIFYEG
ncbi:MAG: hypothetical protein E7069_12055 [Bacteroidales bacterium]|jgi:autotransporter adhesin|nr:hypothetical protein [Bacteroidales bacterium]